MRVLVTGGAGFIGSNLVHQLCRDGHDVRVFDDLSTGRVTNLDGLFPGLEFQEADLRDPAACAKAVDGREVIFHLAALNSVPRSLKEPVATHEVNVSGTVHLLHAARQAGVRRVVFASSSSVYGDHEEARDRETLPYRPKAPYPVSKVAGELYCRTFSQNFGLETVILRLFNVFGPRQNPLSEYAAVIPRFLQAMRRGEPLTVFGDGTGGRDFTYVDNVVHAFLLAAAAPGVSGEAFNIACGRSRALNELVYHLQRVLDRVAKVNYAPHRPGDRLNSEADIAKAERMLGYTAPVDFVDGLRRTAAWFAEHEREGAAG